MSGITASGSSVTFTVYAPGAGTYAVDVFYANTTGATATQTLVVNGASGSHDGDLPRHERLGDLRRLAGGHRERADADRREHA